MKSEVRLSRVVLLGFGLFLYLAEVLSAVAIGDRVQVTSVTNIRSCASTSCGILAEAPVGSAGFVLAGPTSANGFTWWQVDWDSLPTGWSIQTNIATVAVPSVSSVSPTSMTADGQPHTLTINGSNFQTGNVVQFKWGVGSGSGIWNLGNSPSISSSTRMTVSMNPGTVNDTIFVRVCRSSSATSSSDCSSGTQSVAVTATVPVPSVSSINPTSMTADGLSHTLTINGSNFRSGNVVQFKWGVGTGSGTWNTGSTPSISSSSQMTVSMNPGTVNDTIFVRVCRSSSATSSSDCSSGTQSVTVTATVPVPSVSSINPTSMTADGLPHTLTINGSNFRSGNVVQFKWGVGTGSGVWNTGNTPSISSSSQMTLSMNPGTVNDTIFVRVCRSSSATSSSDCSSGTQSVTVTTAAAPAPFVSNVNPTSMTADGLPHTLTINGSNFQSGNVVQFKWGVGTGSGVWNTGNTPSISSSSQMTVSMNPGTVNDTIFVRVCRSSSAASSSDCSSGTQSVTVTTAAAPAPFVSNVNPTSMTADGLPHTLTINGNNFQSGNIVQFKWGVGTNSGTWNTGSTPSIPSSSQMTVSMNPGTVNDTIFVRVCRSSGAVSSSDCSSGTSSVTVTAPGAQPPGDFMLSGNAHCNSGLPAISLSWTPSPRAATYEVFREGSFYANAGTATSLNSNREVAAGQRYSYYVKARNSNGTKPSNAITVTVPSTVCANATQPFWVSLGDSYSSGEGAGGYHFDRNRDGDAGDPGEDTDFRGCRVVSSGSTCQIVEQNSCHRSREAYSQISDYSGKLGYSDFKANVFHACSGAVSANVWPSACQGTPQDKDGWPYTPTDNVTQLEHADTHGADMVTLTIGGNDAKFVDILRKCYLTIDCEHEAYGGNHTWGTFIDQWIEQSVRARVRQTLRKACYSSPGATIYLLGYPKLFPPNGAPASCSNDYFNGDDTLFAWTPTEQLWLNRIAKKLNTVLKEEAAGSNAYFVPMYDLNSDTDNGHFTYHEICGSSSSIYFKVPTQIYNVLGNPEIFHPNATGHKEGYRLTLMEFVGKNPPQGERAPTCSGSCAGARGEDLIEVAEADIPTLGEMVVTASSICQGNGFPYNQRITVSASGFAASSVVSFRLSTESGAYNLGNATADASGRIQAQLTLPAPVDLSESALVEVDGTGSNGLFRKAIASFSIGPSTGTDTDHDGVEDTCDNCPLTPNANQADQDSDGVGDVCDVCSLGEDGDDDGLCDVSDPCPFDAANDADSDGRCGGSSDNCPETFNPGQEDADNDSVGDACDRFPGIPDHLGVFRDGFETGDLSSWAFSVDPPVASVPYAIDANTVALWHFNETTGISVQDETGVHTGEVRGTPATAAGLFGNARVLGAVGSGNYVTVPDASTLEGFPQVTVEAWVFPTGGSANLDLVAKGQHTGDAPGLVIFPYALSTGPTSPGSPSGLRYSFFVGSLTGGVEADSLVTHPFNSWVYLAGTYDGHRARIYVNGQLEAESPVLDGLVLSNANPLFFNNHQYPSGSTMIQSNGGIAGVFDEIRISNVARSASEIAATYAKVPAPAAYVGLWRGTIAGYTSELEITRNPSGGLSILLRMDQANRPQEDLSVISLSATKIVLYRLDDDAQIELSPVQTGGQNCLTGVYLEPGSSRPASLCR
jgi:lysophospholipase L1-like esterase